MNKIKRIQQLVLQLNTYRNEYYNQNNPQVSDKQYDDLYDELATLESQTGFVLSNSPTQTVGYTVVSKLQKIAHPIPLLSLNKTKDITDVRKFTNNRELIAMPKFDGLTTEIEYDNGVFVSGSTRGDGVIGELISHNISSFKNVPMKIKNKHHLRISGESIIHTDDFEKINSKLPEDKKYKTPRNLVAGSVRQLDSKICAERNVYFYAYNVLEFDDEEYIQNRATKRLDFALLEELGFTVTDWMNVYPNEFDLNIKIVIDLIQKSAKEKFIPIDGVVFTFNDLKYGESLGRTEHHPLHSIAFKFYDDQYETVIRDIEWNPTRTGLINPTAIFDLTEIDGCNISRASLSNISIIEELQLHPNSRIMVSKRNMIIPYIEDNLDRNIDGEFEIPKACPSCGHKTTIKITKKKDRIIKVLICKNENCPAKQLDKFVHFVSKSAMNIDGLSGATLEKFIDKGWIKTFVDIYHLNKYKSEIINMDGFGKKSYDKIWTAIQNSRNVKLSNFLVSLGIPNLGKTASKIISKYFNGDWQKFILSFPHNFDWTILDDFGDVIASSLTNYFCDMNNRDEWKSLVDEVTFIKPEQILSTDDTIADSPFTGKKLYATGTFANYKKDQLKELIEGMDAEFTSGYAKSLDYLIVGSLKGSGKVDKALKDGVPVLQEDEFINMINNH